MMHRDSVDKIMTYMEGITRVPFTYKGKKYFPKRLDVSLQIFRGTTCPPNCGACCGRLSLDFLPHEKESGYTTIPTHSRQVFVNGKEFTIHSDLQDHTEYYCHYLNKQNGRCGIHKNRPFSCDFELIRFKHGMKLTSLNTQLFMRGWKMTQVNGTQGAMCEILEPTPEIVQDTVRKLKRLKEWADYFELDTHMSDIIDWAESNPTEKLTLMPTDDGIGAETDMKEGLPSFKDTFIIEPNRHTKPVEGMDKSKTVFKDMNDYDILFASPEWDGKQGHQSTGTHDPDDVNKHYPTMRLPKLKALPIPAITKPDCVLFLQVLPTHIDLAVDLVRVWGFTFLNLADIGGVLVMICKKGRVPTPNAVPTNIKEVFDGLIWSSEPTSATVDIRKCIGDAFPEQTKLELFARDISDKGWDYWGNEEPV